MSVTNDEYIHGYDPAHKAPVRPFIPQAVVDEVAAGKPSVMLDRETAKRLVAERELAYKLNEGYVE